MTIGKELMILKSWNNPFRASETTKNQEIFQYSYYWAGFQIALFRKPILRGFGFPIGTGGPVAKVAVAMATLNKIQIDI